MGRTGGRGTIKVRTVLLMAVILLGSGCCRKATVPRPLLADSTLAYPIATCVITVGQYTGDIIYWCDGKPVRYIRRAEE